MKSGTVALVGRPNTGKSTLVNALVGHKVAITSPKPQTTTFPIYAVYEDERGQIIFIDTPGIFARTPDLRSKERNMQAEQILKEDIDALVYMIDPTRERGHEENRVLGIVRKLEVPKIMVVNKIDVKEPNYRAQYKFMEEEFDKVVEVSARKPLNIQAVPEAIFEFLPEGEKIVATEDLPVPALNLTSRLHVEELIREKVFLTMRKEVPYMVDVVVDEIEEKKNGMIVITARLITEPRYKKMLIGAGGERIKQIGSMTRKELELSTGKKVYLELKVEAE